jgi:hypothetical protein
MLVYPMLGPLIDTFYFFSTVILLGPAKTNLTNKGFKMEYVTTKGEVYYSPTSYIKCKLMIT